MAGVDIGAAYVAILPSTSRLAPGIAASLGDTMPGVGKKAGRNLGTAMASAARKAAKVGMVAVGAAAGTSLVAGFKSAIDQQKAEATLKGLYGSAKEAGRVMSDLRTVASKSSIDYSSYTKTAETLAYMGVSAKDAGPMLQNMGKMIVGAGGSSADLERAGDAMLKMVNSGKVYAADLNQLSQTGIPVISGLATKFFGDASAESIASTRKMVSAGKVAVEDVQEVIQKGTGKNAKMQMAAADEVEKSLSATWKRTKDNVITSIGALLVPIVEKLTPMLAKAGNAVARFIDGMASGKGAGGAFASVLKVVGSVIGGVFKVLGKVVKVAWSMKDVIGVLVGGWLAYKAALIATNAAGWASYLWQSRSVILGATRIAITNAMTAAQRGLNAAMRANPIGLVITALTLLVAGFVLAYKRSETFRRIVNAAWSGIKTAIGAAWNFVSPILASIGRWIGKRLPGVFKFLWTAVKLYFWPITTLAKLLWAIVKPVFKAVWGFVRNHLGPTFRWLWTKIIAPVFRGIGTVIKGAWNNVIKPVFNAIRSAVGKVKDAFGAAARGIKKVWEKVKGYVKKPVTGVLNIYNHVIHAISKIPGLGSWDKKQTKKVGATIKSWRTGGWTGPGSRNKAAGLVHADEFVVNKPARRNLESQRPGALDFMNRTGQWPGYKKGGRVKPLRPMPRASQGFHPGHPAVDYPVPTGTAVYAIAPGTVTSAPRWNYSYGHHIRQSTKDGFEVIYAHLSKIYANAGRAVKAGQNIGRSGNTGNSTGPHLHLEIRAGGRHISPGEFLAGASKGTVGAFGNPIKWLKSIINLPKKIGSWITSNLDGTGPMGDMFKKTPRKMASAAWDFMKEKAFGMADSNPSGKGAKRWEPMLRRALKTVGLPTTPAYVNAWLRQIQTESGGNPNIIQQVTDINSLQGNHARGLLQVIPTTFRRWKHPGHGNIMDPYDNMLAALTYAYNRYGKSGMLKVIGHGHGYAKGTSSAARGWAWVGERGPELVNFRGGEQVVPTPRAGAAGAGGYGPMDLSDSTIQRLAAELANYGTDVAVAATTAGIDRMDRRTESRRLKEAVA